MVNKIYMEQISSMDSIRQIQGIFPKQDIIVTKNQIKDPIKVVQYPIEKDREIRNEKLRNINAGELGQLSKIILKVVGVSVIVGTFATMIVVAERQSNNTTIYRL